jgi:hypothetical protein
MSLDRALKSALFGTRKFTVPETVFGQTSSRVESSRCAGADQVAAEDQGDDSACHARPVFTAWTMGSFQ